MGLWDTVTLDVRISLDDYEQAREAAIERGEDMEFLVVPAEVDIHEALEEATVEQLREALGREEAPGYTTEQLNAIHDCFSALEAGDKITAAAVLTRIFDHLAQREAAVTGMGLYVNWRAA